MIVKLEFRHSTLRAKLGARCVAHSTECVSWVALFYSSSRTPEQRADRRHRAHWRAECQPYETESSVFIFHRGPQFRTWMVFGRHIGNGYSGVIDYRWCQWDIVCRAMYLFCDVALVVPPLAITTKTAIGIEWYCCVLVVRFHTHTYTHTHIHTYTHIHTHTHLHTYTPTHIHTYTHTHIHT